MNPFWKKSWDVATLPAGPVGAPRRLASEAYAPLNRSATAMAGVVGVGATVGTAVAVGGTVGAGGAVVATVGTADGSVTAMVVPCGFDAGAGVFAGRGG